MTNMDAQHMHDCGCHNCAHDRDMSHPATRSHSHISCHYDRTRRSDENDSGFDATCDVPPMSSLTYSLVKHLQGEPGGAPLPRGSSSWDADTGTAPGCDGCVSPPSPTPAPSPSPCQPPAACRACLTSAVSLLTSRCMKGELFDYLTAVVTLSEKRTRQIMRQLLEAVEFVHSKNIAHRDLKPENILLDNNFNVKLSDFGFASVISHEEELTDLCGTPGYLAPEVLRVSMYENATGYGRPVDMWACGVIMYTLLVGCPPFWHRKQMYMLRAIMEGKFGFSSPEWEDVSEPPKDLISRLLVVDPAGRMTAKEALDHPFFKREERVKEKEFFPKRKFKAAAMVIICAIRIRNLHLHPAPISLEQVKQNPYAVKAFRKIIDGGAFRIYGHWVKRGENQNRAALFENVPKRDIKAGQSGNENADDNYFLAPPEVKLGPPRPLSRQGSGVKRRPPNLRSIREHHFSVEDR